MDTAVHRDKRMMFYMSRIDGVWIVLVTLLATCSVPGSSQQIVPTEHAIVEVSPTAAAVIATRVSIATPTAEPVYPWSFQIADLAFADALHGWAIGQYRNGLTIGSTAIRTTADGGRTWQVIPAPETKLVLGSPAVNKIRFANLRDGWAFHPGLFLTHDGGQTWTDESRPGEVIAVEPVGGTAWAIERACQNAPPYKCQFALLFSTQARHGWVPASTKLPSTVRQLFRVSTNEAWLLSEDEPFTGPYYHNRVFVTRDGGQSWNEPNPSAPVSGCEHLAMDDSRQLWLLCGAGAATDMQIKELFISKDDGKHWNKIADAIPYSMATGINNLPILGINWDLAVVSNERAFIALEQYGVIATLDGGRTWKQAFDFPDANAMGAFIRVLFVDRLHGWAVPGQNLIFRTQDGGTTWEQVSIP
jgi:hypothetical protein